MNTKNWGNAHYSNIAALSLNKQRPFRALTELHFELFFIIIFHTDLDALKPSQRTRQTSGLLCVCHSSSFLGDFNGLYYLLSDIQLASRARFMAPGRSQVSWPTQDSHPWPQTQSSMLPSFELTQGMDYMHREGR